MEVLILLVETLHIKDVASSNVLELLMGYASMVLRL